MEKIKNLIEEVAIANFCEDDIDQYLRYLDIDVKALQELKKRAENEEDFCLYNHCLEEIYLLQDIIKVVYGKEWVWKKRNTQKTN